MFQDTLLIIKCDYMHKRKTLLIYLLQHGFQIQGHRKIQFSPELAAEFYQDVADEPCFMFQVILLSKGTSEAFILAKESAVEDLLNSLVCYFGNSEQMEQHVHVTQCVGKVRKEICFIFPNYIFEPIYYPEQTKFCSNNTFVSSLINEVYDIATTPDRDPQKSWKEKLAEWLILSNKALPHVSNQCSRNPALNVREISQQTKVTIFKHDHGGNTLAAKGSETSDLGFDTDGTSLNLTSSSCVTCSDFESGDECVHQQQVLVDIIKRKTAPLTVSESSSSTNEMAIAQEDTEEIEQEEADADIVSQNGVLVVEALDRTILDDRQDIVHIRSDHVRAGDSVTALVAEEKSTERISKKVDDVMDNQPQMEQIGVEVSPKLEEEPELLEQIDNESELIPPQPEEESTMPPQFDGDAVPEEPPVGE